MAGTELLDQLFLQLLGNEEGMIAALSELNGDGVEISTGEPLDHIVLVFLQQPSIDLFLFLGHLYINDHLIEFRDGFFHILLDSPEQVRLEHFLELLDLFIRVEIPKIYHELVLRREVVWLDEVQQGEQLFRVVLNRGACQQRFPGAGK